MNDRACIRCHHPVVLEDGHLTYCSTCGAPQIFLSEELQAEIAEGTRAYQERSAPAGDDPGSVTPVPPPPARGWQRLRPPAQGAGGGAWSLGVYCALLSAGVALGLGLLSLLIPLLGFLTVLWVLAAPILTVALFNARVRAQPHPGSGFTARLGLLTGLLVALCCAAVFTLSLVLTRFVFHDAAMLDAQLAASFAQQRTLVLARLGAGVQPTLDLFAVPEYRVGLLLSVTATSAALYLMLSTLAGGLAGFVLRPRRSG